MKNLILYIIFTITLSCSHYGKINIIKDDFKNVTILRLELYANTNITNIGAKTAFVTFTKSVDETSKAVTKCYISSQFSNNEQPLSYSAFFKIDDKKIKVNFNSTKIIPNNNRNSSWSYHSGEFILSDDLQNSLLKGNNFSIRFYSGEFPFDADFSLNDLKAIQELIKTKI